MIKSIAYENLKGRSGSVTLAKLNLLTGDNFTGKTTILDAVRLLGLGYHPALGKTNKATFALCSGLAMKVTGEFSPGGAVSRSWKQSGKSVNATQDGTAPDMAPVLMPDAFIGASAKDRIKMLAEAGAGGADLTELEAAIRATGQFKTSGNLFMDAEERATLLETQRKDAAADKIRYEKSMATLAETLSMAPRPSPPAATAQRALEEAIRAHEAAKAAMGALEAREEAARDAADALEEIPAPELIEGDAVADYAAASATFDALSRERKNLVPVKGPFPAAGDAPKMKATRDAIETAGQWLAANPTAFDATGAADSLRDAKGSEARLVREIAALQEKIDGMEALTCCPTCKAKNKGWKTEVLSVWQHERMRFEITLEEVRDAMPALVKQAELLSEGLRLLDVVNLGKRVLADYDAALDRQAAWDEYSRNAERLAAETDAAQAAMTKAKAALEKLRAQEAGQKRRAELQAAIAAAPGEGEVNAAASVLADAEGRENNAAAALDAERAAVRAWEEHNQRERDLAEAKKNMEQAATDAEKYAGQAKALRAAMTKSMKALFAPILKIAGPLSEAAVGRRLTMSADGDIGFDDNGVAFTPFEVLSGTEQLIATAAIQAGLSSRAGGTVIIDEFSRIKSGPRKVALANALAALTRDGTLQQVVIIDHDEAFAAAAAQSADGWNIIDTGAPHRP